MNDLKGVMVNLEQHMHNLIRLYDHLYYDQLYNFLDNDYTVDSVSSSFVVEARNDGLPKEETLELSDWNIDGYTKDLIPFAHSQNDLDALHKRLMEIRHKFTRCIDVMYE